MRRSSCSGKPLPSNFAEQTQRTIREAKIQRDRLVRKIQGLQGAGKGGAIRADGNIVIPRDNLLEEGESAYDPTSPLSKELQLYPWPTGYKPRISVFDGKTNPRKFLASYETAVTSAGGVTHHGGRRHCA
jgi:hypothetical protein